MDELRGVQRDLSNSPHLPTSFLLIECSYWEVMGFMPAFLALGINFGLRQL